MKRLTLLYLILCLVYILLPAQIQSDDIHLIIRGDDIGFSHGANVACIKSYQEGIMRTVELMAPCPWFPEAVKLLNENPGLDVGIHITITSEWENLKWGPLTCAPSLTDDNGYFYPMIWPNERFGPDQALKEQKWKIEEIEQEMRAQIEMIKKHISHVSHISCHMGCSNWDPEVREVFNKLVKEYKLDINTNDYGVERFPLKEKGETFEERINNFIEGLNQLEPGKIYLYIEHPATATPEIEAIGHSGYYGVAVDRDLVTKTFTSEKVKEVIKKKNIKLISYKDLLTDK